MKPLDQDLRSLANAGLIPSPVDKAVQAEAHLDLGPDSSAALRHAMAFRKVHAAVIGWTQTTAQTFPAPIDGLEAGSLLALEWCAPDADVSLRIRHVGDRFHAWTLRSVPCPEDAVTVVRRHARTGKGAWKHHVTWTLQDGTLRPSTSRLVDEEQETPHRKPPSLGDR